MGFKVIKTTVAVILGLLLYLQPSIGQITYNRKSVSHIEIINIKRTTDFTSIDFKYTAPSYYISGGWVCADNDFYIQDSFTKNKYKLIAATNIPICPQIHEFDFSGQELVFNLVFDPIPTSVTKFDIIEGDAESGFNFFGVNLKPEIITSLNSPIANYSDCDRIMYTAATPKPSFTNMLSGVKYAVITGAPKIVGHRPAFNALYEYLKTMGFEVELMNDNYITPNHLCEEVWVDMDFNYDFERFYNIKLYFYSPCQDYQWSFSSNKVARAGLSRNIQGNFYNVLRDIYGYQKPRFNVRNRIELPKRQTCWTESKFRAHILDNGCDRIEGIYENAASSYIQAKYKVALRKIGDKYHLIYLSGADNAANWSEGEIKAILEPTATQSFFKATWIMADKSEDDDYYISFESGLMNVIDSYDGEKSLYIKLFPTETEVIRRTPSEVAGSGTGWAISSDGYIATSFHVIDGAKMIKVRGIDGRYNETYSADVIIGDRINDLAILKINDPSFKSLKTIPYIISREVSKVGSTVYAFGYPLRATMGDEVKLTNGIISSRTGFQGDVTSYQITAAAQPGNSGGPLIDEFGNIIAVINAKHTGAESASYAIKTSYLHNIIELIPSSPILQTNNQLKGKPLTEQIQIIKPFVYIIETY